MPVAKITPFINAWDEVMFDIKIYQGDNLILSTMDNDLKRAKSFCKRLYDVEEFIYPVIN